MRDSRARFIALAEARTDKALNAIRLVGNLSNRSNYDYTEAEVTQIVRALEGEIKSLKARFADAGGGRQRSFRLNDTSGPISSTRNEDE